MTEMKIIGIDPVTRDGLKPGDKVTLSDGKEYTIQSGVDFLEAQVERDRLEAVLLKDGQPVADVPVQALGLEKEKPDEQHTMLFPRGFQLPASALNLSTMRVKRNYNPQFWKRVGSGDASLSRPGVTVPPGKRLVAGAVSKNVFRKMKRAAKQLAAQKAEAAT